jgi:hypothetical protein
MNNTFKYILTVVGIIVLFGVASTYFKPELLNTINSKLFPSREVNQEPELGAGTVVYVNDEGVEISDTNSTRSQEFFEHDPIVTFYQDTVPKGAEAVKFTGTYDQYNTGCFADGDCYVIVDGNQITTILGWTGGPVGLFENPDLSIGTQVEVYALPTESGKYTLYGSEEYYIREV